MTELKPCPFCGGEAKVSTLKWVGGYEATALCKNEPNAHYLNTWDKDEEKAIERITEVWNRRVVSGDTSDGYHTFDELYYHRTALFACLVSMQPRQMAFKSWKHADGTMFDGMFIAGIFTSMGWCTYHCEAKWWPLFDCHEQEFAPEWDGHTPSDAIHRLMSDFLPNQDVSGEVDE